MMKLTPNLVLFSNLSMVLKISEIPEHFFQKFRAYLASLREVLGTLMSEFELSSGCLMSERCLWDIKRSEDN